MAGAELLWMLAAHLVLTGLPGVAAALLVARYGVRDVPVLLAAGIAATGALAMLTFWAYYADPLIGETFSYFLVIGSVALCAWVLSGGHLDRGLLRRLGTPLGLWVSGSIFLVFLGFLHGGTDHSVATAATRFSGQLPSDNYIPDFFAEWFFHHGHHGVPPIFSGGWLASDRPPLQLGYVMAQRPFGPSQTELHYTVLGVVLQQLWIVGLWALLVAARVGRVTRALTVVAVLVSDLAIVNGFFVWPKLLPAAMLLAAAALILTPLWTEVRRSLWAGALVAALFGLAMMGHGSSLFGIVPLALIALFRGLPSARWIGVAALVGLLLIAPWSAYQKYGDPPGNRLTKWMLAGVTEIDGRGTGEAISDAYGEAGLGGTIHNKAENFVMMSGGAMAVESADDAIDAIGSGKFSEAVAVVRAIFFYYLVPSLGLLLLGPLVMLFGRRRGRRRPAEWSLALGCFAVFALGALTWGLVLFGTAPARASVHIGSYLVPILGICGAVVGLRAVFPRFAVWFVGVAALFSLALYVPALMPEPGSEYSLPAALLVAASLAVFGLLAFRDDEGVAEAETVAALPA